MVQSHLQDISESHTIGRGGLPTSTESAPVNEGLERAFERIDRLLTIISHRGTNPTEEGMASIVASVHNKLQGAMQNKIYITDDRGGLNTFSGSLDQVIHAILQGIQSSSFDGPTHTRVIHYNRKPLFSVSIPQDVGLLNDGYVFFKDLQSVVTRLCDLFIAHERLAGVARLAKQAICDNFTDIVTGGNNRKAVMARFDSLQEDPGVRDRDISVLCFDIDFFKKVNDTYGHQGGDIVLKEFNTLIVEICRTELEGYPHICGRIGGEEFCVVVDNYNKDQAFDLAERIRQAVEGYNFLASSNSDFGPLHITSSIGIFTKPEGEDLIKDASLSKADLALYKAKDSGRNNVQVYGDKLQDVCLYFPKTENPLERRKGPRATI